MAGGKEYLCPSCGGKLQFDSGIQKMKCQYCGTELDVSALEAYDDQLNDPTPDDMSWGGLNGNSWDEEETGDLATYICDACGGEIITDKETAASSCPFCGNPVVMMNQFSGSLKPDYVIPFKLDKEQAKEAYRNHLKGKILLPKSFHSENHIDEIKGVYVPFWLFDANADAAFRYRATRTHVWEDRDYIYTRTSFYSVFRKGSLGFDHVPVDGSAKMADDLMESIEPFDFKDAVDFRTAYLSGYLADRYDVPAENCIARANERIRTSTEQTFESTVTGYVTVQQENANISLKDQRTSYALFPVWFLNTTWHGKNFNFAMNAQTGLFVGDLPTDNPKMARFMIGFSVLFMVIIFLFFWFAL